MKKHIFIALSAALMTVFLSCNKDPEPDVPAIILTTKESGPIIFYLDGSGLVTINWGDGTAKETRELPTNIQFYHFLEGRTPCTIKIYGNGITNFKCERYITSLDVSGAIALKYLDCSDNQLTSLDVSNNIALEYLDIGVQIFGNPNQLTNLDVSNNTVLEYLDCSYNQLTSLDVSNNIVLEYLDCSSNQLTSLDVSNNSVLSSLRCLSNDLQTEALNALFHSLHSNMIPGVVKSIIIFFNPGAIDCDIKIANDKGWHL